LMAEVISYLPNSFDFWQVGADARGCTRPNLSA
jgi:hypothetical protein